MVSPKFLANFATLGEDHGRGPVYERLDGESQKQFQARMLRLPGRARDGLITHYFKERPSFPD